VLDWRATADQLAGQLADAGSRVLFVAREFHPVIERFVPELGRLRHVIALDGGHRRWPDYRRWRDAQRATRPLVQARGEDELLHLYAHGIPGATRPLELSLQAFEKLFRSLLDRQLIATTAAAVVRNTLPLFHPGGVNRSVLPLLRGAHLHLLEDVDDAQAAG